MRRGIVAVLSMTLLCLFLPSPAFATVEQGSTCNQLNRESISAGYKYRCIKSGKSLAWGRGIQITTDSKPTDSVAFRIDSILQPSEGISGVFVKSLNNGVISNFRHDVEFEPASSLKVLIAYYAFSKIASGKIQLNDVIPTILAGSPSICPNPHSNGRESIAAAIKAMMQISDNNRTTALMQYFGVPKLNTFAKSIGLKDTRFNISLKFPGFIPMGCASPNLGLNPGTVHGNVSSLRDLTAIWGLASNLQEPFRSEFMELTAGREMAQSQGYDFSGIWPALQQIVNEEAPPSLSQTSITEFMNTLSSNSKGGSDVLCTSSKGCTKGRWWLSMVSLTTLPICQINGQVSSENFVWGYFLVKADSPSVSFNVDNPVIATFNKVGAEPMREQIRGALANWGNCFT